LYATWLIILKEQTEFKKKKMLAYTSLIKAALSVYILSQEENTNGRKLSAWMLEH
jgi:hypothetical protein